MYLSTFIINLVVYLLFEMFRCIYRHIPDALISTQFISKIYAFPSTPLTNTHMCIYKNVYLHIYRYIYI